MAAPDTSRDARLVARLLARDGEAWRELVDTYWGAVAGSCRRGLLRAGRPAGPGEIEEAVAEIFRLLLEDDASLLRRFRRGSPLGAYLRVIAWTKTLSRAARTPVSKPLDEARLEAPTPGKEAEADLERLERLRGALARLPERDAQALRWFYEEGLSYEAIAERTGLGMAGVGMMLSRAREKLKRQMEPMQDGFRVIRPSRRE